MANGMMQQGQQGQPTEIPEQEMQQRQDGTEQGNQPRPEGGDLSFSSDEIEQSMVEQLDKNELEDFGILVDAGNEILFGEQSHYQILDGFEGLEGEELAQQMAHGAVALTDIIVEQSGGSVAGELVVPAATVLMARVAEFLNKTGLAPVTDEVFEQAMEIYSVKAMDKYDPEFREQAGGMQQEPRQGMPQEQGMSQGSPQRGILNQGGM